MDAIAPARRPPVARGDRLLEADLLRCVAMLSVVALHADAWMGHDDAFAAAVYPAFDRFLRFCVPVFAFLTGYVLTGTSGDRSLDWPSFARRRALRTAVPLAGWLLVYLMAGLLIGTARPSSPADVLTLVWNGTVGGHLYFLAVAGQLALLFGVLPRGRRAALVTCAVVVPLQLVLSALRAAGWAPHGAAAVLFGYQAQWFSCWWAGYYTVGCLAAWYREPLLRVIAARRWVFLLLPAAVAPPVLLDMTRAGATGYDAFFRPSTFALTLAVIAALAALATALPSAGRGRDAVDAVAHRSLGVYLVHPLVLLGAGRLVQSGTLPLSFSGPAWLSLGTLAVVIAAVTGVSLLVVEVVSRLPHGWLLVGETGARRGGERGAPAIHLPPGCWPTGGRLPSPVRADRDYPDWPPTD
jgi:peptidoglycan/LPS O-acetylase OafA/YrhL